MAHFHGKGVLVDYVTAHMWLNISSSNGHDPAARDNLTKLITPEQIQEAQTLARDWVKLHGG
jgi:TPR repeat protein